MLSTCFVERSSSDELAFLADTAGAQEVARFTQRLDYPNPRTFVGKGSMARSSSLSRDILLRMMRRSVSI